MAGKKPNIIGVRGILGAGPHDATGDLGLLVGLVDGTQAIIQIEASILSGLELLLRAYLAKTSPSDDGEMIAARPLQLMSVQPFAVGDGRVGIVIEVDHMRFPIAIPVESAPSVIESLNRMVEMAENQPKRKMN